jgi:hypothetical protein
MAHAAESGLYRVAIVDASLVKLSDASTLNSRDADIVRDLECEIYFPQAVTKEMIPVDSTRVIGQETRLKQR